MSLIRCFECKKKVSIKADACPNCGCPMNKDYIKELNEIEEQINEQQKIIKEQQETINGIKVQVKGQVEDLEKEKKDLIRKRVLKRKLIKQLRKQNKKEKKYKLYKYLFYISILIVIVLLFFICNMIKELDTVNKKLVTLNKELLIEKKLRENLMSSDSSCEIRENLMSSDSSSERCKDEEGNTICQVYEFTVWLRDPVK